MHQITLSIDNKNLETVMNILQNLKYGLIDKIETNSKISNVKKTTQYQPKTNTIIREEESGTSDTSGKYISAKAYKNRLKVKNR